MNQVVDMRWGVRDEATDDHQTVDMCNREIETCQRVSLGPNFVALIGDKYGFRPLPNRIKSTEFRALRRCLIELDVATDILDTWYKEDLNAIPPEHLLQPISSVLKNFTNRNEPDLQSLDQRIWQAIQERLHELLLIGSARLVKQGRLTERERSLKYSISVTEREVIEGCLSVDDAKSHCLIYVRSIVDLRSKLEDCLFAQPESSQQLSAEPQQQERNADVQGRRDSKTRRASLKIGDDSILLTTTTATTAAERRREQARRLIGRFIDLKVSPETGGWHLDEDSQEALKDLKENKFMNKLSSLVGHNMKQFEVHWADHDGLSANKSEEHRVYLNELIEHMYAQLTKMIRRSARIELDKAHFNQGLVGEVLQHSHHAAKVSALVSGRAAELEMVRAYLTAGLGRHGKEELVRGENGAKELGTCLPMFVYGVDGSGKTSVLARAATQARDWILRAQGSVERRWDNEPCVVMRFGGTTPASSSMIGVLTSVCDQLQYNFYQYGPLNAISKQESLNRAAASSVNQPEIAKDFQLPEQSVPTDIVRLMFTFRQLLENCAHQLHRKRTFVIILDSLERLSTGPDCSMSVKYAWLINLVRLPANVRLIVSCNAESKEDFALLKRHFLLANFMRMQNTLGEDPQVEKRVELQHPLATNESSFASLTTSGDALDAAKFREQQSDKIDRYKRLKLLITPAIRILRLRALSSVGLRELNLTTSDRPRVQVRASLDLSHRMSEIDAGSEREDSSFRLIKLTNNLWPKDRWHRRTSTHSRCWFKHWILHIKPLGVEPALSVAKHWLGEVGRDLTQEQWALVRESVTNCSRPIFVRLAFGEIVHWKSYSVQGSNGSEGLTFGSHLLQKAAQNKANQTLRETGDAKLDEALRKLHRKCDRYLRLSWRLDENLVIENMDNFHYQWHLLSMEQQWLNFLDYTQRKHKITVESRIDTAKLSVAKDGLKSKDKRHRQGEEVVVIRLDSGSALKSGPSSSGSVDSGRASGAGGAICLLSLTIEDAINQLFARLELQHGQLLTKHSLSYITAARTGICENELEDVLSLDDTVLDDVFQYHLPPVRRIPPLLWTRIRNDLNDFLSERDADGVVIGWNHSQFRLAAERRYLSKDRRHALYIHSNLADYFLGKWADKAKPFKCTRQQILMASEQLDRAAQDSLRGSQEHDLRFGRPSVSPHSANGSLSGRSGSGSSFRRSGASISVRGRLRSSDQQDARLQMTQAKADRRVAAQPLQFETTTSEQSGESERGQASSGSSRKLKRSIARSKDQIKDSAEIKQSRRRYNMRKLAEMPFHLMHSERFLELANLVFFNYKWLYAQLDTSGLQNLLIDLGEAQKSLERHLLELDADAEATKTHVDGDEFAPGNDYTDPSQLERLDRPALRLMMRQLTILESTLRLSSSTIQSDLNSLATQLIGRLLPVVREHSGGAPSQQPNPLLQLLKQCDREGSSHCGLLPINHVLQSPGGLQSGSLEGHPFGVMHMDIAAADSRHLLAVSNRFIMWDIGTGEIVREIDPKLDGSIMRKVCINSNGRYAVAFTSNNVVIVLDVHTQHIVRLDPKHLIRASADCKLELVGLDLVGTQSSKRFIVWTKSSVFVLRIIMQGSNLAQAEMVGEPMGVELDYLIDSGAMGFDYGEILDVKASPKSALEDCVLILFEQKSSMCLVTLECPLEMSTYSEWIERVEGSCLCLDPQGHKLVFGDSAGNVWLSRRRQTCWSRAKMLASVEQLSSTQTELTHAYVPFSIDITLETQDTDESTLTGFDEDDQLDTDGLKRLTEIERQVDSFQSDGIERVEILSVLKPMAERSSHAKGKRIRRSSGIKCLQLYYQKEIVVVFMGSSDSADGSYERRHLQLPVDICNVCISANESQIKSIVVSANQSEHLVAAYNKVLLFYDLEKGVLTRSVEAHSARISQILCLSLARDSNHTKVSPTTTIVSASMDKSVKLWNLDNIHKDSHDIECSGQPIEYMSVASHKETIAACLESNELIIWNWSEGVIKDRLNIDQVLCSKIYNQHTDNNKYQLRDRLVRCSFSSTGKHLLVASLYSIVWLSFETDTSLEASDKSARLQLVHKRALSNSTSCLVRKIWFLNHETRILIAFETDCTTSGCSWNADLHLQMQYLSIVCYDATDLGELYCVKNHAPLLSPREETLRPPSEARNSRLHGLSAKKLSSFETRLNYRLPILTLDQSNIVTAEFADSFRVLSEPSLDTSGTDLKRRLSSIDQAPMLLRVYSTRDGQLLRSISLSQLSPQVLRSIAAGDQDAGRYLPDVYRAGSQQIPSRLITITNSQFTRMKSAKYQENSSTVGLINESGFSFLIDIQSGQVVSSSSLWSGKLSSDGRYGLSRVFKSASFSTGENAINTSATAAATVMSTELASKDIGGLHLIEMRRFKSMKVVLSTNELNKILSDTQAMGNDMHLKYGFTKPNDSYIYLYDSRAKHLLLVRLRDNSLIAKYKLPVEVTKIRCSPDGYTLILAHSNGSLTCLAIVDPQSSDTLLRLSQHPSRRLWKDAK